MPGCQDRKEVSAPQAFVILGSSLIVTNTLKLFPLVHAVGSKSGISSVPHSRLSTGLQVMVTAVIRRKWLLWGFQQMNPCPSSAVR